MILIAVHRGLRPSRPGIEPCRSACWLDSISKFSTTISSISAKDFQELRRTNLRSVVAMTSTHALRPSHVERNDERTSRALSRDASVCLVSPCRQRTKDLVKEKALKESSNMKPVSRSTRIRWFVFLASIDFYYGHNQRSSAAFKASNFGLPIPVTASQPGAAL